LIGLVVDSLYRELRPRLINSSRRALAVAATIFVLAIVFMPPLRSYGLHVANLGRSLRGESTVPVGAQLHARFVADAARFMRDRAYASGSTTEGAAGFSVLGPWGDGHILKAIGGLAVVQDNFGDDVGPENFARAEAYFSARTEAVALGILAPMHTRYVLVRSSGSGHESNAYYYKSLFSRLYRLRGNRGQLPKVPEHDTRVETPLVHHRLIYQSQRIQKRDPQPYIMIFEIVAGAELVGRAHPQTLVTVALDIAPREGSRFLYNDSTKADAEGFYRFRLPYANESSNTNVSVGRHYIVRVPGQRAGVVLSESDVLSGARVEGPNFDH
jgi:asparagine N-glycosylation enzyme membrane subunit Stt3